MRFKRDGREPQPVEPFSKWQMLVPLSNGSTFDISGLSGVGHGITSEEELSLVDAIADGLRRAGFDPKVILTREVKQQR